MQHEARSVDSDSVLCFLLEISLVLMFKSTLKALTANSIRTISRAISFGTINYFSLFGEQNGSQLC